jgi:integrase
MAPERKRRELNRLSAQRVKTQQVPGRYADGGGLYLVVDPSGSKRWAFIYRWKANPSLAGAGRLREMGLGGLAVVSLADARKAAEDARRLKHQGVDPITAKRANGEIPTFGVVADEVIRIRSADMKSDKSVARIRRALEVDANAIRHARIDSLTTEDVLRVLTPIWNTKPSSARETRAYIEAVFDAAKARGHRTAENPARWKGHLDQLLESGRRRLVTHHAAMAYADVPSFVRRLREDHGPVPMAFEFLILTAARTSEVLGAIWPEIDLQARIWTVPGVRMKAGREHRVPLCARAHHLLAELKVEGSSGLVFPGRKEGRPLSNMAFDMLLRRRGLEVTTHGFRSSFRDWVYEQTNVPREVAEAALAHSVGDTTERAYRRGDALGKRRDLMESWARYLNGEETGSVVELFSASAISTAV